MTSATRLAANAGAANIKQQKAATRLRTQIFRVVPGGELHHLIGEGNLVLMRTGKRLPVDRDATTGEQRLLVGKQALGRRLGARFPCYLH